MHRIRQIAPPVYGSVALGACSAFGDWVWARYIPDGAVLPGVVHGVLIFVLLAVVLGWAAGTRQALVRLVPSLPVAGLAIAAAFYPLASLLGYVAALLVTWVLMWVTLATAQRWARGGRETFLSATVRAGLAAVGSGFAFWAISGIWTQPDPDPNYVWRFVLWTFAFLPGFLALLVAQPASDS